ncbi:hypothetical protein [Microbispora catharanthi]|uniref:Uncharacterized protein n=1 Tax=Microbispora catharanthi TaxID=1712871 RepID=A0A5N6C4J2_9ACTN|nr:hypothetical protein [Microbispora catharanthi]KAB8187677.1 hypothetical protein FH610_000410 [Microbispora catharanthi]
MKFYMNPNGRFVEVKPNPELWCPDIRERLNQRPMPGPATRRSRHRGVVVLLNVVDRHCWLQARVHCAGASTGLL